MAVYPEQYYQFFISFNEGDYYTCHDLLEEMWLEERSNLFIKGLLQFSVALYHYSYGNVKGTRLMLEVGRDYLAKYGDEHWQLEIKPIIAYIDGVLTLIPTNVERVEMDELHTLPSLPPIYLWLQEQ